MEPKRAGVCVKKAIFASSARLISREAPLVHSTAGKELA